MTVNGNRQEPRLPANGSNELMAFTSHVHRDYLEMTVRGQFDLAIGKACVDELFRLCAQHALSRVLVDAVDLFDNVSIASRFNLGEYLAASSPQPLRIAVRTSTKLVDASKALENTANNRGRQLLTTDSMQAALEFLEIVNKF